MAQLDRFLSVMVTNNAESILLVESDVATLQKDGVARPITRQPLTAQQLLALLQGDRAGTRRRAAGRRHADLFRLRQ